nr:RNA-directed DNA polymerase, eukaryota [Tanacetum cinerariifolium]
MEGLHVALEDAIAARLYRCLKECFHRVSGLKINYHKSNLFGVGVPFDEVSRAALITGCNSIQTPFSYLGLPIDCNMANVKNWDPIVDKFFKRLSKWKSSMLSIIGRATLISSVLGSIGTYYFSMFPMPITVILTSKENGGLGIGSLYSLNQALIQKWRWRFFNNPNSLWVRLLTSIHGDIDDVSSFLNHVGSQGVWGRIVGSINTMHEKGYIPLFSQKTSQQWCLYKILVRNVGMLDSGLLDQRLEVRVVSFNLKCQLANYSLSDSKDDWSWAIGTSSFIVKTTREHIDQRYIPNDGMKTRWNHFLSKKINIFIWRALRDRLPTKWNLSWKGIDVDSLSCPIYDAGIKTIQHFLWFCSVATTVWHRIFVWLHITPPMLSNIQDLYLWIDDLHISSSRRTILDTICSVIIWTLWNFRNETTFGTTPPKRCTLIDKIVDFLYSWYSSRNNLNPVTWNNWLQNPLVVSTL